MSTDRGKGSDAVPGYEAGSWYGMGDFANFIANETKKWAEFVKFRGAKAG